MDKLISIIIPSYNMEKYLRPCCESLVASESIRPLLEVLIINDGSKDGTLKLARFLESSYSGVIRVIDKPNGNYGSCINRGLAEATGKYIKVLDADDTVDPQNFADFVAFVQSEDKKSNDVDLFLADYCVVNPAGEVTGRFPLDFPEDRPLTLHDIAEHGLLTMHEIVYRTEMLRAMGYRQSEGISYTDNEWCFLPILKVRTARYFKRDVYRYLVGREGQTVSNAASSRSQGMYFKILQSLAASYLSVVRTIDDDGKKYLQGPLAKLLSIMYKNCALNIAIHDALGEFRKMDTWVKHEIPEFYAAPSQEFLSSSFRFHYVRFLRCHGKFASVVYLRFMRTALKVIAKIKG